MHLAILKIYPNSIHFAAAYGKLIRYEHCLTYGLMNYAYYAYGGAVEYVLFISLSSLYLSLSLSLSLSWLLFHVHLIRMYIFSILGKLMDNYKSLMFRLCISLVLVK